MHVSDLITASDIMASYSNFRSKVLKTNVKQITNFSIAMPMKKFACYKVSFLKEEKDKKSIVNKK